MSDETPTTETVATEAQAAAVTEAVQEEAFDKDRAMLTIHKLREAEKEAKKQLKELAELKAEKQKNIDATLSETEKLKKQADELAKQNAQLQADIIRRDVVAETGLPALFADRLKGATKEEMLEDAKELMKALPAQQAKQTVKVSATNPANAGNQMTDDARREFLGLRR
jgi:DNA repair exonuclease SbcCD ATPase subunit